MNAGDHEVEGGEEASDRLERGLGRFLAVHHDEIMAAWGEEARRLPTAKGLEEPVLLNSLPDFLDALAKTMRGGAIADEAHTHHLIEEHALDRLEHGYSLSQVTSEFAILRDVILRMAKLRIGAPTSIDEVRVFHRTIDKAIELAIAYFVDAQERVAQALDRISVASLESRDLDQLLRKLMRPVLEALTAVDTVSLLLREGDRLRVRVAEGLGREAEVGFTVKIGEGFAGTIAATMKPSLLRSPSEGSLLRSPHLRAHRARALYGVPLIADGEVIGVAHMGSLTAYEFRRSDVRLLDAMAARATAAISQQVLKEETARLLEREQVARKGAEREVRLRKRVLAVVSHDLRNPLGAIRMSAELILRRSRELDAPRVLRHAQTIARSVSRMDRLIVDLVDVASIESGGLQTVPAPVRVDSLIREATQLQEPLAAEKSIRLRREDSTGDAMIEVDRERMLQVFANLIGNALKYSDPGQTITVRANLAGSRVLFAIADSGPGIPADEVVHIFEPYWTRTRNDQGGLGLGLVIAKAIVEAHAGQLWVETEAGQGATFCFSLPRGRGG